MNNETIEHLIGLLPLLISGVFGFLFCFWGRRFLKFLLTCAGFILGMNLVLSIFYALSPAANPLLGLILGVVGGIAGCVAFALIYRLGLFMVGFAAGFLLAPWVATLLGLNAGPVAIALLFVLGGICTGLLALFMEKSVMVVISAIVGAQLLVMSVVAAGLNFSRLSAENFRLIHTQAYANWWWGILILTVAGVLAQLRAPKKSE